MAREPIPEELRRFILTSVPSVPFVEAMLVFRGAHGMPVDTDFVARRLYMGQKSASEVVAQLREARILSMEGNDGLSHRYQPDTPELAAMLDSLAEYYRTHLVEVTDMIHSRTSRKAQQFADAFKLRKDT